MTKVLDHGCAIVFNTLTLMGWMWFRLFMIPAPRCPNILHTMTNGYVYVIIWVLHKPAHLNVTPRILDAVALSKVHHRVFKVLKWSPSRSKRPVSLSIPNLLYDEALLMYKIFSTATLSRLCRGEVKCPDDDLEVQQDTSSTFLLDEYWYQRFHKSDGWRCG